MLFTTFFMKPRKGMQVRVLLDSGPTDFFFGGFNWKDRPRGEAPLSSSPHWFTEIVVADDPDLAVREAPGRLSLSQPGNPSCTNTSKNVTLIMVTRGGAEVKTIANMDAMVVSGEYNLATDPPEHIGNAMLMKQGAFDPDPSQPPQTVEQKAWRVMSALSESLLANFAPR